MSLERFTLVVARLHNQKALFATDVGSGLVSRPKTLPCRYFYDEEGSALFEEICKLPEYYPTRTEREILEVRAGEIVALVASPLTLVELGSGSAEKTRLLIESILGRQATLRYIPIDISQDALKQSSQRLVEDYRRIEIDAIAGDYQEGLGRLPMASDGTRLILWLGSNVGNFHRDEAAKMLRRVAAKMGERDRLLVGIDLRKNRQILEPAYDDSQGVTARFNLNLLARINHELGGRFDLSTFHHRAVYDENIGRIEMYLVSDRAQQVHIDALGMDVSFAAGEAIHTEDSYKYSPAEIDALAEAAGLAVAGQWFDQRRWFSETMFVHQCARLP
jgi:dimethylhistidine N-methyltransferase